MDPAPGFQLLETTNLNATFFKGMCKKEGDPSNAAYIDGEPGHEHWNYPLGMMNKDDGGFPFYPYPPQFITKLWIRVGVEHPSCAQHDLTGLQKIIPLAIGYMAM